MKTINIQLEITTRCKTCGDAVALNAAVNKVWCPKCNGQVAISSKLWTLLFNEVAETAKNIHLGEARRISVNDNKTGTVRLVMRKNSAFCPECKEIISSILADNNKIVCKNCNTSLTVRNKSDGISSKQLAYFFSEDKYQLEEAKQKSNIQKTEEIDCNNCGGSLDVDGSARLVDCPYCQSKNMLSDQVWHRLHPSAKVRIWNIGLKSETAKDIKVWTFNSVEDVCYGKENTLYCTGKNEGDDFALWAMTPKAELKWMTLLPDNSTWGEYKIALLPNNQLLVWNKAETHHACIYDAKTGEFIKKIGGLEPLNAKKHHFDLYHCNSLATDPDGTIICLIALRILRYSKDGEGIYTWGKPSFFGKKLKALYKNRKDKKKDISTDFLRKGRWAYAHKIKNRSLTYSIIPGECSVHIGNDSSLYILNSMPFNIKRGGLLAKFNRKGKIIYKVDFGAYDPVNQINIRTDEQGFAYILLNDSKTSQHFEENGRIIRVSPDGKEVKVIVEGSNSQISAMFQKFAVSEDGNIYTIGIDDQIRHYDRNGEQIWRSKSAQEFDNERN